MNAFNLRFESNPRLATSQYGCQMKLQVSNDSKLYVFANLTCINQVTDMLDDIFNELKSSKEFLQIYKGASKD